MKYQDQRLEPSNYAIIRWFGFDQFVPETAVTSYWVSPKVFFAVRLVLALYTTITLWVDIGVTASGKLFAYFTTLTFIGLHAYLVTACVHHFRYLRNKNMDFMLKQPAVLNYLYVYLYSTVITFNIVTPVVFWSILAKAVQNANTMGSWLNASVHAASFFLMIIDVILNRMKVPIRMVILVILTVLFYMFMAFIIFATNGFWVYPFLRWDQGPSAAIWYFAVALIVIVAFFIQILIHYLRDLIARKTGRLLSNEFKDQQNEKEETGGGSGAHAMTKLETDQSSSVV